MSIRVPKTFDSCSKKKSVFICAICGRIKNDPCAKNIREIRAIRVQRKIRVHQLSIRVPKTFVIRAIRVQRKNPCLSVSIRVPKIFDSCSKKIRVQKSSPPKSHTPMQNPGGPPLSYLACPETTIPISRHDHYHYLFTSLHNLLAIHNIHTMRQAADTGTCSDTSAVKGIDATFLCITITA